MNNLLNLHLFIAPVILNLNKSFKNTTQLQKVKKEKQLLNKRQRIQLWIASTLTALVGIVNLLSAVTPNLPGRTEILKRVYSF